MTVDLAAIRACFDGKIPSTIATCAPDGMPNVSYLSEVEYVDACHVALSYQFFNKTRANILVNPRATLNMFCPITAALYQLTIEYLRTETTGPLFESMRARLAGIATLSGMHDVFRLLGADVYRVDAIARLPGRLRESQPPQRNHVSALKTIADRLARAADLAELADATLDSLAPLLGFGHSIILAADNKSRRLYTLASRGFDRSGIGSEVDYGAGVIGIAARERTPIRIAYATAELAYSRAVHVQSRASGHGAPDVDIPLPELAQVGSQLAVPIMVADELLGVIAVQSAEQGRFSGADQDTLATIAAQFGLAVRGLDALVEGPAVTTPAAIAKPAGGAPVRVRHYAENDSVFLDDDYLIKGVAGAILWKLVREYAAGRSEFTNRELRLAPDIRLPELAENLEARLVLLTKRLEERSSAIRIERTGRGRFRLRVERTLELSSA